MPVLLHLPIISRSVANKCCDGDSTLSILNADGVRYLVKIDQNIDFLFLIESKD